VIYYIAVDGVDAATGIVHLSFALDRPPVPLTARRSLTSFGTQYAGVSGRSYRVQVSIDLIQWSDLLTTNLTSSSSIEIIDPMAYRYQRRFYRIVPLP